MSTVPSADAKAVVRALEGLTTQVRRLADTRQSDFALSADALDDDATTPTDDTCRLVTVDGEALRVLGAGDFTDKEQGFVAEIVRAAKRKYTAEHGPDFTSPIAGNVEVRKPCPYCGDRQMIPTHQFQEHVSRLHPDVRTGGPGIPVPDAETPAADEDDTLRWTRRESLLVLLTRLQRGRTLTEAEADTLRQHVETEIREANAERAEADALDVELTRIRRALDPDDERYIQETVDDFLNLNAKLDEATDTLRRVRAVTQAWEPLLLPRSEAHRLFVQVRDALTGPRPDRDQQPTTEA